MRRGYGDTAQRLSQIGKIRIGNSKKIYDLRRVLEVDLKTASDKERVEKVRVIWWYAQRRQQRLMEERMRACQQLLGKLICENKGSFYMWERILAQDILSGRYIPV